MPAIAIPSAENLTGDKAPLFSMSSFVKYVSNAVYRSMTPDNIYFDGGYVKYNPASKTYQYYYYIQDHLNSTRAVVKEAGTLIQAADYLASGIATMGFDGLSKDNRLHTGKEFDSMHGLNLYDNQARLYDPVYGNFTGLDRLSEDYYGISPYAHCANNPIRNVDPDGKAPRVYVETKGFGHAFVTVGEGKNTVVYTYGRYGELSKDKSSAQRTTPIGEGVLIKLTGNEGNEFIKTQMLDNEAVAFEFKNGSDETVAKHFDSKFNSSDKVPTKGKYANSENAKVVDKYNLLNNNCVTTSVEGVQSGVKQDLYLNIVNGPAALKDVLNVLSGKKDSGVTNVTYEDIKKELKLSNGASSSW